MYIDTHAHVNFSAFKDDADKVIKRALENQVFIINVGSQYSTSARAVKMAEKYDKGIYPHTKANLNNGNYKVGTDVNKKSGFSVGVYAAIGLHPIHLVKRTVNPHTNEVGNLSSRNKAGNIGVGVKLSENDFETTGEIFDYQKYLELAKNPKVVAIGEMGLDYHHFVEGDNILELKAKQKEIFLAGIKLANETKKPIIVHCWDAYDDLLEILKNNPVEEKGVIHSFIGGYKTARKFTELGFKIGLNGIITYSPDYSRLVKELALEDILLETDCPYLAPAPYKGERNEPLYVKLVAEKIAQIKELSVENVAEITANNAKKLFNLGACPA